MKNQKAFNLFTRNQLESQNDKTTDDKRIANGVNLKINLAFLTYVF